MGFYCMGWMHSRHWRQQGSQGLYTNRTWKGKAKALPTECVLGSHCHSCQCWAWSSSCCWQGTESLWKVFQCYKCAQFFAWQQEKTQGQWWSASHFLHWTPTANSKEATNTSSAGTIKQGTASTNTMQRYMIEQRAAPTYTSSEDSTIGQVAAKSNGTRERSTRNESDWKLELMVPRGNLLNANVEFKVNI